MLKTNYYCITTTRIIHRQIETIKDKFIIEHFELLSHLSTTLIEELDDIINSILFSKSNILHPFNHQY